MDTTSTPSLEETKRASRELRNRILNVLPAATYQMDRFLSLVDITFSDSTATAAMECGPQPVMLVNRKFVETHCQRDEHLMMLVMHEIYHLILGHTRLFPRATLAHNIVFDAVINALLCQQFRDPLYTDFFTKINSAARFPGRLLRPPQGWPGKLEFHPKASENERKVMQLLYGPFANTITYHEIMALLSTELPEEKCQGETLLGDHAGTDGEGANDPQAQEDDLVVGVLRETTKDWPRQANPSLGRSDGKNILNWLMPKTHPPRAIFLKALGELLRKAGVLPADPRTPYAWKRMPSTLFSQTALYDGHDRTVESRFELYGEMPVLFSTELASSRLRWTPRDITHIYMDVSGSMDSELPWLAGALEPLHRRGLCRLYAFSTVVAEIQRTNGFKHWIANTGGTDINCVYAHLLSFPKARTPAKVVVLTDGYTGSPHADLLAEIQARRVDVLVGLTGAYASEILKPYVRHLEHLPAFR